MTDFRFVPVPAPPISLRIPGADLTGPALTEWLAGRYNPGPDRCPVFTPAQLAAGDAQDRAAIVLDALHELAYPGSDGPLL